jgi:hypothetical protein
MELDFGSFVAGAAQAGTEDLGKRRDQALRLKLESRLIEMQVAKEKEMLNFQRVTPSTLGALDAQNGVIRAPGEVPQVSETAALGMLGAGNRTNINANARARGGSRKYDREALVDAVLKNPVAYNDLTASAKADIFPDLQKRGFKRLDKKLTDGLQVRADTSLSGLDAINRVNARIAEGGNDFAQLYAPGQVGARKLRADLLEIVDVVKRIRSGMATNANEDDKYQAGVMADSAADLLDDVLDGNVNAENISYQINTIYKPYLERMSRIQERQRTEVVEDPKEKGEPKPTEKPLLSGDDFLNWQKGRKP